MAQRILLVDDHEPLRAILAEELRDEGYEVETAANGSLGMEALRGSKFDLVVLDIRMPVMDGLDALGKMLARDRGTPIVIHTAYGSYREDYRAWSADAYVVKSPDSTTLLETIRSLLDRANGNDT